MTALIFVLLLGGIAAAIAYTVTRKETVPVQKPLPVLKDPVESPGKPDVPEVIIVDYITPEPVVEKITPEVVLEAPKAKASKPKATAKPATKTAAKKTSKKVTKK